MMKFYMIANKSYDKPDIQKCNDCYHGIYLTSEEAEGYRADDEQVVEFVALRRDEWDDIMKGCEE